MKTVFDCTFRMTLLLLLGLVVTSICLDAKCFAGDKNKDKKPTQYYLVGVGPGDADLMTLRAVNVIKKADLIFCSRRRAEKLAPYLKDKEVIGGYWRLFPFYGKDPSKLEGKQRERCEAMAVKRNKFIKLVRDAAAEGKIVAMLDGGDPMIYGPCAWSLEEFEDLNPEVVPGVSCFNAANAALRRGITTSDRTKSVTLTAADWMGKEDTIARLSVHQNTMVLFTMRTEFKEFIDKLAVHYPPETPIAIVKHAGYADKEEVIYSTVGNVLNEVGKDRLPFEYLIYVGEFLNHRYKQPKTDVDAENK